VPERLSQICPKSRGCAAETGNTDIAHYVLNRCSLFPLGSELYLLSQLLRRLRSPATGDSART